MSISPSISKGTINAVRNLAEGWGQHFIGIDPLTEKEVKAGLEDIFGTPDLIVPEDKEEAERNARLILEKRKYWEMEEARRKEQEDFYNNLERGRPVLRSDETVGNIDERARSLALRIADTAIRSVELNLALNYAKSILSQDVGIDVATFPDRRIINLGKDIGTVPIVNILCEHFGLSADESRTMLDREIAKLYAQHNVGPAKGLASLRQTPPKGGALMGDTQPAYKPAYDHSFPSNPFAGNSNLSEHQNTVKDSGPSDDVPPASGGGGSGYNEDIRNQLLEQLTRNITGR